MATALGAPRNHEHRSLTVTQQPAHSKLGASSMYRWSACPGSVREAEKAPAKTSSRYAEEGSDAHALAAQCLKLKCAPGKYLGKLIVAEGRQFTATKEITSAVQVYLDAVDDAIGEHHETAVVMVEQRFDLSEVHPGCFGTADTVIWLPATKMLVVMDYKHGAGVPVKVEGNPQLQYYGLGALLASGYPADTIRLVVVQPRCEIDGEAVRHWDIDTIDLLDFKADLVRYAKATEQPDAPLVPGDHCRFCPAAATCDALAGRAQAVAKLEFKPTQTYDPEKLKLALDSREPLKAWLKALDEFAYAEAEAGRTPVGYKLVAKRASRKWRDEGDLIETLQDMGVADDVIFEPRSAKSPAQLEKAVGKDVVAQHAIAESSGHVLVPEGDKRPAIKLDAKSEFVAVPAAATSDLFAD